MDFFMAASAQRNNVSCNVPRTSGEAMYVRPHLGVATCGARHRPQEGAETLGAMFLMPGFSAVAHDSVSGGAFTREGDGDAQGAPSLDLAGPTSLGACPCSFATHSPTDGFRAVDAGRSAGLGSVPLHPASTTTECAIAFGEVSAVVDAGCFHAHIVSVPVVGAIT
jgi:hypothetical protein